LNKILALLASISFIYTFSYGQAEFGTINDPDGYTNVREGRSKESKVVGKVFEGEVFWILLTDENDKSEWKEIYLFGDTADMPDMAKHERRLNMKYKNGHFTIGGFIHESRLLRLNSLKTLSPVISNLTAEVKDNEITVTVFASTFRPEQHGIDTTQTQYVGTIDGRPVWGEDGGIPKTMISGLSVFVNIIPKASYSPISTPFPVPAFCYNDLYAPRLSSLRVHKKDNKTFFVTMSNSDGAGWYEIAWVFINGKYSHRTIGNPS